MPLNRRSVLSATSSIPRAEGRAAATPHERRHSLMVQVAVDYQAKLMEKNRQLDGYSILSFFKQAGR